MGWNLPNGLVRTYCCAGYGSLLQFWPTPLEKLSQPFEGAVNAVPIRRASQAETLGSSRAPLYKMCQVNGPHRSRTQELVHTIFHSGDSLRDFVHHNLQSLWNEIQEFRRREGAHIGHGHGRQGVIPTFACADQAFTVASVGFPASNCRSTYGRMPPLA